MTTEPSKARCCQDIIDPLEARIAEQAATIESMQHEIEWHARVAKKICDERDDQAATIETLRELRKLETETITSLRAQLAEAIDILGNEDICAGIRQAAATIADLRAQLAEARKVTHAG